MSEHVYRIVVELPEHVAEDDDLIAQIMCEIGKAVDGTLPEDRDWDPFLWATHFYLEDENE